MGILNKLKNLIVAAGLAGAVLFASNAYAELTNPYVHLYAPIPTQEEGTREVGAEQLADRYKMMGIHGEYEDQKVVSFSIDPRHSIESFGIFSGDQNQQFSLLIREDVNDSNNDNNEKWRPPDPDEVRERTISFMPRYGWGVIDISMDEAVEIDLPDVVRNGNVVDSVQFSGMGALGIQYYDNGNIMVCTVGERLFPNPRNYANMPVCFSNYGPPQFVKIKYPSYAYVLEPNSSGRWEVVEVSYGNGWHVDKKLRIGQPIAFPWDGKTVVGFVTDNGRKISDYGIVIEGDPFGLSSWDGLTYVQMSKK